MKSSRSEAATQRPTRYSQDSSVRRWLGLSVGALITAGLFSLGLIIGRMPPFSEWVSDPQFFKRCLVVHVDLALIVWFYAFITGLFCLIPRRPRAQKIASHAAVVSAAGVLLMVLSAGVDHAEPVLANYVPVVDHPLFLLGLGVFAMGVLTVFVSGFVDRFVGRAEVIGTGIFDLPGAAAVGLQASALLVMIAAATFVAAWFNTPQTLETHAYYELLFWGGGHVLQVACEAAMLSVWIILLSSLLERPILGKKAATILFALLSAPHLIAPFLTLQGTQSALYHAGSTRLMQYAIFPVVLLFLGFTLSTIRRAFKHGELDRKIFADPRFVGFVTSAGLALLGFVLGAMIRGSNTMIPAHYHAAIGAVTVAFMTVALLLLEPMGLRLPSGRWHKAARLQPILFGVGQLVFAAGFAFAGAHGMARKTYASEQSIRGVADWIGLATMGIGGVIAIFGGLLFLALIGAAFMPKKRPRLNAQKIDEAMAE